MIRLYHGLNAKKTINSAKFVCKIKNTLYIIQVYV